MTLARIISIGVVTMVALAIGIAAFDPVYAQAPISPCCGLKDGTWIVLKTGKPASPAQIRTMGTSQSPSAEHASSPKPAGGTPASPSSGGGGGNHK